MQHKVDIGIIGGTGVYGVEGMQILDRIKIDTPWGHPSDAITIASYGEGASAITLAFLPRHGKGHFIPPT
ncbi:MAG TPA: S-methyl-5'-thioadenosine phosphorylase, partial [Turneriella sp.]|nr:S-methyl-5'-thioadenosine phosphorylase [Turneriella sp.]